MFASESVLPTKQPKEVLPDAMWCLKIDPIYIVEFNSRWNLSFRQHLVCLFSPVQDLQIEWKWNIINTIVDLNIKCIKSKRN